MAVFRESKVLWGYSDGTLAGAPHVVVKGVAVLAAWGPHFIPPEVPLIGDDPQHHHSRGELRGHDDRDDPGVATQLPTVLSIHLLVLGEVFFHLLIFLLFTPMSLASPTMDLPGSLLALLWTLTVKSSFTMSRETLRRLCCLLAGDGFPRPLAIFPLTAISTSKLFFLKTAMVAVFTGMPFAEMTRACSRYLSRIQHVIPVEGGFIE